MKKKLLLFGLAMVSFSLAAQSPWPRSKAGFFVQAAWQTIPAYTSVFTPNPLPDRQLSENAAQLYGEYGLNAKNTLLASLPFRFIRSGKQIPGNYAIPPTQRGALTGLGNASLSIKRALFTGNLRLSGIFKLEFPSSIYDENTGLRAGYNAWALQTTLSTGMGLGRVYWFAYAGYGWRSRGYSAFANAGGELGFKIKNLWLIGFSELLYSQENGDIALSLNNRITHLFVDKQGWWSLGAKIVFETNRFWGFTASYAGAGWAQRVPKSPGISLGAYFKWD